MLTILLPLLVTVNLFVLSKTDLVASFGNPWLFFSQLFSLLGTVLLSFTFVLGSRARFLEKLFGGLDKVIKIHHIIGAISFILLLHHPLFLAVQALPNFDLASRYLYFGTTSSYNFGVIAIYGMIILLALTLVVKLPYDVWIKTHDLFGIVLFFASLHIFFITSDVSRYMPLRIWMFINLDLGLFFYIYKVFLYRWFGPKYEYTVSKINQINDVYEIYLTPVDESIRFKPGQFCFVSFDKLGLTEAHPFSFSSSPDEMTLRFSVKIVGDYTLSLKNLTVGTKCSVWGAYGKFYYGFDSKKDVVFLAGGIGITPFMSLLNYEVLHIKPRKIHLFYSSRSLNDAIYDDELLTLQTRLPNFTYFQNFGDQKPRLNCQTIISEAGDLHNKIFYICGPTPMMYSLASQLKENGVKTKDIIFEDFAFKS